MDSFNPCSTAFVSSMSARDAPLVQLGRALWRSGYHFTTVTPATHAAYLDRNRERSAVTVRDVFGWNMAFAVDVLPVEIRQLAREADVLTSAAALVKSTVRFSTTASGQIFVHSGGAEGRDDMVFFGPDSYRYLAWLDRHVGRAGTVVDIGCGSGVGGLHVASRARKVVLNDLNPRALKFAQINAAVLGIDNVEFCRGHLLAGVVEPVDVIISNPPYMMDPTGPTYRNGGGVGGAGLSVRIVDDALGKLAVGGKLVLHTATTFVDGEDQFSRH